MSLLTTLQRAIAREGQALTLSRIATGVAPVSVACTGVVRGYQAHELVGNIIQGDRRVILSNVEITAASWPGPPRKGDQVTIAGTIATVQAVNTVYLRGVVAKHELLVRG